MGEDPGRTGEPARRSPARRALERSTRPLRRMWWSEEALDHYALVHLTSVAGDTLLAVALAGSIFFALPVDEARTRVALYLALTMAPLAVAGPTLVPLLDRSPYRRAVSFGASAGRALLAAMAVRWAHSLLLFPVTFGILVLSKMHLIVRNGLTAAYAPPARELVDANAFMGRVALAGFLLAGAVGAPTLSVGGPGPVLALATAAYGLSALLTFRLPPASTPRRASGDVARGGRVPHLAVAAAGNGGLRGAQGFLFALTAFALRAAGRPPWWFGILLVAGAAGAAVGDLTAPRLPRSVREEVVVIGSLVGAGVAALFAFQTFSLLTLAVFAALVGTATEFGRLAFQSLMQTAAPRGAQGRVFVRYEVAFQLAWVAGAFLPSMFPIPFRGGILALAGFYLALGVPYLVRLASRGADRPG